MSNNKKNRVGYYLFIAVLAVLFALQWGPGSQGCDRLKTTEPDAAAMVNGQPVPLRDFARAWGNQLNALRAQGVPTELAKQFGVHKQVLDQLVNTELLAQAAEARGLKASDADLKELIVKEPVFQKNGKFDFETYKDMIRNYEGMTETAYEERLRRQIAAQRMLLLVENGVAVSADEVKARYLKEGNKAKASFVRFTPAMYASQVKAPTPTEAEAWAKDHEAEIASYYETNKVSYFQPERVKARQILLRIVPETTDAEKADLKAKAENLRKELVDNKKDFAELAKQFSEDTETRDKGGELGTVERLQLPAAFADVLFALQPGEVSVPVETPLGFYLGTVEEKFAPSQKPLDEVKAEIASVLFVRQKAKALAQAAADKALADAKAGKTLTELFPVDPAAEETPFAQATNQKPQAKETGEFNASSESIPQLGVAPEALKAIFGRTEPGLVDRVVSIGDTLAVVNVDERTAPSDEEFEKQKAQLTLEAVKGKQFEAREAFLKSLKTTSQVVTNEAAIEKVIGQG